MAVEGHGSLRTFQRLHYAKEQVNGSEPAAAAAAIDNHERVQLPLLTVLRQHPRELLLGTFAAMATFVLFYLMTVFTLSWGTSQLGYARGEFLQMQMIGVLFFALTIPLSAWLADRHGPLRVLLLASVLIAAFGLCFGPLFAAGSPLAVLVLLALGLGLMGLTYGPLGTLLAGRFPTAVRYTGASLAFNLAGIIGASLAPYIATWLATRYGIAAVGYYLCAAAAITVSALIGMLRARMPEPHPRDAAVMQRSQIGEIGAGP